MIDSRLGRYALGLCVAVAVLTGCGGRASSGFVPTSGFPDSVHGKHKFKYTGGAQDFAVPEGVTHIRVVAVGARGAGLTATYGGRVHALIPVVPGETLEVYVGGDASGSTGGFNGGANGGEDGWYCYYRCQGYGGGGSSDVREGGSQVADRIIVAGGGGGQGGGAVYSSGRPGGDGGPGGGKAGAAGDPGGKSRSGCGRGGAGGTQHHGGAGGRGGKNPYGSSGGHGSAGSVGQGGNGGDGSQVCCYPAGAGGGGGGGGYEGGGGGGGGYSYLYGGGLGGGGGGGSSYAERRAKHVKMLQGWSNPAHNGSVEFSW